MNHVESHIPYPLIFPRLELTVDSNLLGVYRTSSDNVYCTDTS